MTGLYIYISEHPTLREGLRKKWGSKAHNKGEIGGGVLEMRNARRSRRDHDGHDGRDKVATNQDRVGKTSRCKRKGRDCTIMSRHIRNTR